MFLAKLSRKYRVPTYPCLHTYVTPPTINILYLSGMFVTVDGPTLTHRYSPKSIDYIKVYSWYCIFCGVQRICNDVCLVVQYHTKWFHCAKSPAPCLFILPPPLTSGNHWAFYCLHGFAFPECCMVGTIQDVALSDWPFDWVICFCVSPMSFEGLLAHCFLALNNPRSGYTTASPFTFWRAPCLLPVGWLWIQLP